MDEINKKAKILCSVHACCSMGEGRRLVTAGMFDKALRKKGINLPPATRVAFDVSNVIDEDEFIRTFNQLKED